MAEELYKNDEKIDIVEDQLFSFLRGYTEHNKDADKFVKCLKNLKILRVKIPLPILSNDLIPLMISDNPGMTSMGICDTLMKTLPFLSFDFLYNAMMTYHLNCLTQEQFDKAVGFMVNVKPRMLKPDNWNSSLARSFLTTDDAENLLSILCISYLHLTQQFKFFAGQHEGSKKVELEQELKLKVDRLFRSLFHVAAQAHIIKPGVAIDDIVEPVLQELISLKIGVPSDSKTEQQLMEMLKRDDVKELLNKATKVYDENQEFWTKGEADKFSESRRQMWIKKMRSSELSEEKTRVNIKNASTKEELEEVLAMLSRNGKTDAQAAAKLLDIYLAEKNLSKFNELYKDTASKLPRGFNLAQATLAELVEVLLSEGRAGEARDLIVRECVETEDRRLFRSTLMKCCAGLAESGDQAAVMQLLEKINPKQLIGRGSNVSRLLSVYAEKGEVDKLQEVSTLLITRNISQADDLENLVPLIDVHLTRKDVAMAVAEFVRISKVYKKLPRKFNLTQTLIVEENVDAIQEVLEASSAVIGEDKSILDLAHNFLALGRKNQAQKLLETPGLRYLEDRFLYIFDNLRNNEENGLELCELFVQVSKNVFNCNRNLLYTKLVEANSKDADKVDDIWLQVQEEGIIPNDALMRAIGIAFKKNGRDVPFDIPDEPKQEVKPTNQSKNQLSSKTTEAKVERKRKESTSSKPQMNRYAHLSTLIDEGKLDEAHQLVLELLKDNNSQTKNNRLQIQKLFNVWDEQGNIAAMKSVMEQANATQSSKLQIDKHYKNMLIKNDSSAYIDLISSSEDAAERFLAHSVAIETAVAKDPSLVAKFEKLASDGNMTATMILAKLAMLQNNEDQLLKWFEKVSSSAPVSLYVKIFDKMDSLEKMNMALNVVGTNEDCVNRIIETTLARLCKSKHSKDVARVAVERGLNQTSFSRETMKKLEGTEAIDILTEKVK